ncbi:DUF6232 family protein [Actinophytocola oryzae]|uniref:Uncharacterized protein n=1 Tax=Actinophytocola oryzae TaxID=502181 RepID=A0A4R7VYB7_9PSEU|nr:DUF6232 family protein [Actinophytocola oryzae]TDV55173.1 hypothetical protein CLV71_103414 [Actinophytocola oryzae]
MRRVEAQRLIIDDPASNDAKRDSVGNTSVTVRVEEQILWIDGAAYPLQNIARAELIPWKYRKTPVIMSTLKWIVGAVALYFVADMLPPDTRSLAVTAAWIVLGAALVRAAVKLRRSPFLTLALQTSAGSSGVLQSEDATSMRELVNTIMKAINNPAISQVFNIQTVEGNNNIVNSPGANARQPEMG